MVYIRYFRNIKDLIHYINDHSINPADVLKIDRDWNCAKQYWMLIFAYDLNGQDEVSVLGSNDSCAQN